MSAERLKLVHNGRAGGNQLLAAQQLGMEGPIGLAPILGLSCCSPCVSPGLRGPPYSLEEVEYFLRVLNKDRVEGSFSLQDIQRLSELLVGQVRS